MYQNKIVLDSFVGARALIADPSHWQRGCARYPIALTQRYCLLQAVAEAAGMNPDLDSLVDVPGYRLLENLVKEKEGQDYNGVGGYNDSHDHADVMALLDEAIASITATGNDHITRDNYSAHYIKRSR